MNRYTRKGRSPAPPLSNAAAKTTTAGAPLPGAGHQAAPVDDDAASHIAQDLQAEFDRGVARRAELARQAGLSIYCKAGCTNCCQIMVMIYRPEALVIKRWLQETANRQILAQFRRNFAVWQAAVGQVPARLARLFREGPPAEYDRLHMEQWGRRILCPFVHDGSCSIYPVRPISCRNAHALDTDERCVAGSDRPAEAVEFVPLAEFMKKATQLLRTVHNASGATKNGLQALPQAVMDLLPPSTSTEDDNEGDNEDDNTASNPASGSPAT